MSLLGVLLRLAIGAAILGAAAVVAIVGLLVLIVLAPVLVAIAVITSARIPLRGLCSWRTPST